MLALGAVGVLLVPIGIPLAFYLKMRTKVQQLGGQPNESAIGGAKLVADDSDDESDQFAFLCGDYKPLAWYWETVSYARKLCLNGWAVVVGRGTMGQASQPAPLAVRCRQWHPDASATLCSVCAVDILRHTHLRHFLDTPLAHIPIRHPEA